MKTFYIKVFGCQYNEWDATRLSFLLKNLGLIESEKEKADLVFIVNCSVRKSAVDRAMGWVKNLIQNNQKVIITGCVLETDRKKFLNKGVSLWDGENLNELSELLQIPKTDLEMRELLEKGQKMSNLLPIMKGCNNFCSYCAVPYTRGRETSRPVDQVIMDAEKMVEAGHREIWLLGQNVNSYEFGFAKLLRKINDIPGDFKIFFTSNHPKDMNDEIIEGIANTEKIAKSIHLPLQSGSDKILKAMNRPYTRKQYLDLIDKIRKNIKEVVISTDVIVGFPGETEEDFNQTVDIFKQINFETAYINKYSPRPGTVAFKLGDLIPWSEKEKRWVVLNDLIRNQKN
jgi:tRNA-2-methylthio-N6-dimethylallyladenosine synthase